MSATLTEFFIRERQYRKNVVKAKRDVHGLALLIAGTGLRLPEVPSLRRSDVNLNSMLVPVRCGKGGKSRVVPMSVAGRRVTFKWLTCHDHDLVFCTRDGLPWTKRNALRSFKLLCAELGISGVRTSWHTQTQLCCIVHSRGWGCLQLSEDDWAFDLGDDEAVRAAQHGGLTGQAPGTREVAEGQIADAPDRSLGTPVRCARSWRQLSPPADQNRYRKMLSAVPGHSSRMPVRRPLSWPVAGAEVGRGRIGHPGN